MNREELKALGLTDDQIDKVMAAHGKVVNSTKEQLDTVTTERDSLKEQITERDTQLDNLSKQVKDNEELTAEINRLKEENQTSTSELQQKLDQQAFDFTLDKALSSANVRNSKALKALLDLEKVKLDGEKLLGLDDQLTALKESDAYLFQQEEKNQGPTIVVPGNPNGSTGNSNPFSKESWNLTEQGRLFKENPELYNHLKAQAGK